MSEDEIARVTSLRLTPCWRTLGLVVPTLVVGAVALAHDNEPGQFHALNLLGMGVIGAGLLGFSVSLLWWSEHWAEFNRRPRAWFAKYFEEFSFMAPFWSTDWIPFHQRWVLIMGFGSVWVGGGFLLGAFVKAFLVAK